MKAHVTLPSTKPDHLYSSQQSQVSLHPRPPHQPVTAQLAALLSSLRNTHKLRYYLLPRDLEAVFAAHQPLLSDLLGVSSSGELWASLAGQGVEQLREQEQVALLLRLLLELNTRRHAEADRGDVPASDRTRAAIDWLVPQIAAYESEVRAKLEQQLMATCEREKQRREGDFQRYERAARAGFEEDEAARRQNLAGRLQRETRAKEAEIHQKIQRDMHKIRASSQLRDAKDTALLRKLAPYRWDKKRPYEDATLRADLEKTVEEDGERRARAIEQLKRTEQARLRRRQETLVATQEMHAETQRERLHIQLENEGTALRGHEEQALRRLRHTVDLAHHHRVSSLRKSLEAFTARQDTLHIRQILQDHHARVQFCNTIEQAVEPQAQAHHLDHRYATLHTERHHDQLDTHIARHQRRLSRRIGALLAPEDKQQPTGRRSLVDLYDDSLALRQ